MRHQPPTFLALLFLSPLLLLLGCPSKQAAGTDAAAEAAVAVAAPVDAGPMATNEADVTRYPDEAKLDRVTVTILAPRATLLKAAPKGAVVATLKKGDGVQELAEHNGYFLVLAPDPKDATKKVMGWVAKFAFDEPAVAKKAPVPKCTTEGWMVVSDKSSPIVPRCAQMCSDDTDCPNHDCGSSLVLNDKTGEPLLVNGDTHVLSFCTAKPVVGAKDAGAGPVADAGKPATTAALPKCKDMEVLVADGERGKPFCKYDNQCSSDKDCKGGKCTGLLILNEDGTPARLANGGLLGRDMCMPK